MNEPVSQPKAVMAWFARNSVAANLLLVIITVGGLLVVNNMPTEVFPEITSQAVTVSVSYPDASAEEVESAINIRVEAALAGIAGVKRVSSTAEEGLATITSELTSFANPAVVAGDITEAVDAISGFPSEGVDKPKVSYAKGNPKLLTLALYGEVDELALRNLAEQIRDDLLATSRLADVKLDGVRAYEFSIEVSATTLDQYDLKLADIAQKITATSLDLSGGNLKTANGEILLRTPDRRIDETGFASIPIIIGNAGEVITLADVATISDGFADAELINQYNGQPAVFISVYRANGQGVLSAERVVKEYLDNAELPVGLTVEIRDNATDELRDRINLMLRNAVIGFGLVFLSLVMFLDLRLAFWTSLAIPVSFLGGLAIAGLMGATINMVSLFALIIVLGIVVDDAVVVGENIFAAQHKAVDKSAATLHGLYEVAAPVTLGVCTTMLAFLPLTFTSGTLGQIVSVVPVVVIAILLASLVESLLILPAHLSVNGTGHLYIHGSDTGHWSIGPLKALQKGFSDALALFTRRVVYPLVRVAATFRYATVTCVTGMIIISATAIATAYLRFEFLPSTESDRVELTLILPAGAAFQETSAVAERAIDALQSITSGTDAGKTMSTAGVNDLTSKLTDEPANSRASDFVRAVSATIGQAVSDGNGPGISITDSGANIAQIRADLLPSDQRTMSSAEFASRWREALGPLAGVDTVSFASDAIDLGSDISVQLSHVADDQLLEAANALRQQLSGTVGVSNVQLSQQFGKKQLEFVLNATGIALGINSSDLARQIRRAFRGETVQTLQRSLDQSPVVLRYPAEERNELTDILNFRIRLPGEGSVPLSMVASVRETQGFTRIERSNNQRVLTVIAAVESEAVSVEALERSLETDVLPAIVKNYPGLVWSMDQIDADRRSDLINLLQSMAFALLGIFVLLAAFTRSYLLPIVILSTVMYGVLGALAGHAILGYPVTFISLFGIVALSGVVINDTILLLHDYRRRIQSRPELAKTSAIAESAARRFRPILITSVTTALGLTPMIYEPSEQAQFLVPMAISLGYGILIATPILLLVVPATLLILDDLDRPFRWLWQRSADLLPSHDANNE